VFAIDAARLEDLKRRKPWLTEPKYFKRVKINAVAAMKMVRAKGNRARTHTAIDAGLAPAATAGRSLTDGLAHEFVL
jgi:hypothetical protein